MNQVQPQPLSERISDALALINGKRTLRCPQPGCLISIRYSTVTPDEAKRLINFATDHTHH